MKLNCLLKDTRIVNEIRDYLVMTADVLDENNLPIDFPSMYAMTKKDGIEVDAESLGKIYVDAFGKYNSDKITTESEIVEMVGASTKAIQQEVVNGILGKEKPESSKTTGMDSAEKNIKNRLLELFGKDNFPRAQNQVRSDMLKMQDMVKKAMVALLPSKQKISTKDTKTILDKFFEVDGMGFPNLQGGMNTMDTLHAQVKKELDAELKELTKGLSDEQKAIVTEKWNNYMDGVMNSMYSLMIGKGDGNFVMNKLLKEVTIDGRSVVDKNDNILWDMLSKSGNAIEINSQIKNNVLKVLDDNGNPKYTERQAQMVADYVTTLYEKKKANVIAKNSANVRMQRQSASNLISDFIKEKGFFNLMKSKDGKLASTQSDWESIIKEIKKSNDKKNDIDKIVKEVRAHFDKKIEANTEEEKIEKKQRIEDIAKKIEALIIDKLMPNTFTASAMEKFIALSSINNGNAFNEQTQHALNKLIGVDGMTQDTLDKLNGISRIANSITNMPATINGIEINRGKYAFQLMAQLNRLIKEVIREHKGDKVMTQKIVNYLVDSMNTLTGSKLINPKNWVENIGTNMANSIAESIRLLMTSPSIWKSNLKGSRKTFWDSIGSQAGGGSAMDIVLSEDMGITIPTGERIRPSNFRKFKTNPLGVLAESPHILWNSFNRVLMNSIDFAYMETMYRKHLLMSTYDALINSGTTKKEAIKLITDSLNVSDADMELINKTVDEMVGYARSIGLRPTLADIALTRQQVMLSEIEKNVKGELGNTEQISNSMDALSRASKATTKMLLGKQRMPVASWNIFTKGIYALADLFTSPQRGLFAGAKLAGKDGRPNLEAGAELGAELSKNSLGMFANGVANFMSLALTFTPSGFFTATGLYNKAKSLLKNDPNAGNLKLADPKTLQAYYTLMPMARAIALKALIGTTLMASYVLTRASKDDGEDDDWLSNLMKTKEGRKYLFKMLPMGIAMVAVLSQKSKNPKDADLFKNLVEFYSQVSGSNNSPVSRLSEAWSSSKSEADKREALVSFISSYIPSGNLNQVEDIQRNIDVLQSAQDPNYIDKVEQNQKIASDNYKAMSGIMDYIVGNGWASTILRSMGYEVRGNELIKDDEIRLNRFSEEAKDKNYAEFKDMKLESLYGVGEKNLAELKKKGVQSVDDLMNKDKKELERLGFTEAQSIRLYNDLHLKGSGTTPITDLKITEDEISILKRLGYNGIDASNKSDAITDIKNLKKKSSYSRNSEGDIKIKTDEESVQKVKEYNNILEQLQKVE